MKLLKENVNFPIAFLIQSELAANGSQKFIFLSDSSSISLPVFNLIR